MKRALAPVFFVFLLLVLTSGCAVNRATGSLNPGADLKAVKTFYVVQPDPQYPEICELIRSNLSKRGYDATSGPALQPPYKADMVVTFVDKWDWDLTMYLLELTIIFRDPATNVPVGVGNSLHSSFARMSPPDMVDEVLNHILAGRGIGAGNEQMAPGNIAIAAEHPHSVCLRILGARETGLGSIRQLTEANFTQALEAAIIESQIFSRVMKGNSGEYLLTAIIAEVQQPQYYGLRSEVGLEVAWTLSNNRTGQTLWHESVKSKGTGDVTEATENAAKNNMTEALAKISKLNL